MYCLLRRFFLLTCLLATGQVWASDIPPELFTKSANFDDVRDNLSLEVTRRGMVLTNSIQIGDMLEKTGKDVGGIRPVYLKAETLEFCSPLLARKLMEANSGYIIYCPFMISVYVLPETPKQVNVAYRKLPKGNSPQTQKIFREVDVLMQSIVKDALKPKEEPEDKETSSLDAGQNVATSRLSH